MQKNSDNLGGGDFLTHTVHANTLCLKKRPNFETV